MGLAEELLKPPPGPHRGQTCTIQTLLHELDETDPAAAKALRHALTLPRMASTVIARRLTDGGYPMAASVIQRHRRRECLCPT